MATEYEVVGACITDVPTNTAGGEMRVTLYKGARITSASVPAERIAHLLDVGLIAPVGQDGQPVDQQEPKGDGTGDGTGGGSPAPLTQRSTRGELVEHGVRQGGDRAELEKLSLKQLQDRYLPKPPAPAK